jgi:hypothetical protein
MSDRGVTGLGLSGARFLGYEGARDLTGCPGIPGTIGMAWQEWRWPGRQCAAGSR